ncbi:hypothetical protein PR202_gb20983 [Eleusine coracana subsp. coracana]|uniref:AAA+ ATPase domain-containing protein n=1 Tax=Eleusine coracana subsp. coracana TaxID=191504 RepID=A0AAV5F9Z4_ELECO|nr:hypothetical protein PR202_gb20983 [Eleusine coracana subsp. coracana]
MDLPKVVASSPSYGKAMETYRKAAATAATVTAYAVLARGMARELLPDELRDAARRRSWPAAGPSARRRSGAPSSSGGTTRRAGRTPAVATTTAAGDDNDDDGGDESAAGEQQVLTMVAGDSISDVFEGVEFTWASVAPDENEYCRGEASLDLSFDAEHVEMALRRYIPFVTASVAEGRRCERALKIFLSEGGSWRGITHQHPATFDTLAMDPALKNSIVADLDRFRKRKDYYRRIGKAWKRGYLLYGPPGTGKSSMVAAMANYLRFNIYDLDISAVNSNSSLQWLLTNMSNKSILVIEDIDCCFSARSRSKPDKSGADEQSPDSDPPPNAGCDLKGITLSGLLNFIDGLWSTSGEERIIIFTTNYKDRLDPALLRPGRMDMHVYMGYCCWEAFKTLANNYFLIEDHQLFTEIRNLLAEVEVTPAMVSEMLLRNEHVDVAFQGLVEFLQDKKHGRGV